MSSNKKKNLLMLALVFCCCLVSVGYFTLINAMVVEGNIKLKPAVWDISFKSIKTVNTIGKAQNYRKPVLSSKVIEFFVEFDEVGDTIIYEFGIVNRGDLDARLESVYFLPRNSEYFDYSYDNLYEGMVLKAGQSLKSKIQLKYAKGNASTKQQTKNIKLVLNWEQDD